MSKVLKYVLITANLLISCMSLHAQSLNPDTLKKYHISEILTYKVDSAGKKVLQGTRIINDKGRTNELTTRSETYLDSSTLS